MDGVVRKASTAVAGVSGSTDKTPRHVATNIDGPPIAAGTEASASTSGTGKKVDKHSFDYMMRSSIAGGLAGCAVRIMIIGEASLSYVNHLCLSTALSL